MFSYLLGIMVMTIYNQTYGSTAITTLMDRYNNIMEDAMSLSAFSAIILTIKSLAVGITLLLYLIDLSGKVTEKNFSIEQFFKATLRCVVAYMFIMNSDIIVGYLMDLGNGVADGIREVDAGYDFFNGLRYPERKTMLINGLAKFEITEVLGYIVYAILPWVLSMIGEVVLQVILISRILEIVVMTIFAPVAISDIYRSGTQSTGVQYMKKILALGLQIAVILLINTATQAIVTEIVGSGTGQTMTSLLKVTEYSGSMQDALANGSLVYTKDSLVQFLDALVGKGDMIKILGIMLARIGLIWNSMPLCEEITGAK